MAVIRDIANVLGDSKLLLYPTRQRCFKCRRCFGFIVVKRLYCSYECADMPPPNPNITARPRYCRTRTNEPKRAYRWDGEVTDRNHKHETIHVYFCDHCGMYHIGHQNPTSEEAE